MADVNPTRASLGRSLALQDGDLIYQGQSLLTVEQLDALAQALKLTLETQLGTDRINTTYGFDRLSVMGSTMSVRTRKELVKLQLVSAIGRDRRVKDVKEIFFNDEPRYFDLHGVTDPSERQQESDAVRSGRDYQVYALIETIQGQVLTVPTGGTLG